ncbi:conserved hypothetical protein [Ixodes scapularis]|uniref:Uncharacterized protein n=1 Tax=Ixodes scapularis TaxID=6945 RepID=B7Q9E3_IXOSC|nr:conserved hypothetical protein [Ixodes scapularis]|eukprot:XP_002405824.1 conserved hypothetical protein [Ixodes scapularis]
MLSLCLRLSVRVVCTLVRSAINHDNACNPLTVSRRSFFASKPGASKKKPDDAPKSPEKELNGSGLAKPADVSKESPVKAPRKRRARIMTDSDEDEDAKPASPAKAQPKEEPAEDSKERAAEVSKKEPEEDGVSKGSSQTSQLTSPDGVIKRRTGFTIT